MNNPMEQLAQWKANHQQGKINRFVSEMNRGVKAQKTKTQQEAQNATKAKRLVNVLPNPLSLKYAQITRQFKLI